MKSKTVSREEFLLLSEGDELNGVPEPWDEVEIMEDGSCHLRCSEANYTMSAPFCDLDQNSCFGHDDKEFDHVCNSTMTEYNKYNPKMQYSRDGDRTSIFLHRVTIALSWNDLKPLTNE